MVRFRVSTRASEIIAWLGLLLIMVSFLTLLLTPEPFSPRLVVPQHKKVEPFALVILDRVTVGRIPAQLRAGFWKRT